MNSLRRLFAIMQKEFRQLKRDRVSFGMIVMIPLIQLMMAVPAQAERTIPTGVFMAFWRSFAK